MRIFNNLKIAKAYSLLCLVDEYIQESIIILSAVLLPIKAAYFAAKILGLYEYFAYRRIQGERIEIFLRNANVKYDAKLIKNFYINNKKSFVEQYLLAFKGARFIRYINANTQINGIENISKFIDGDKNFICATAHFGNMYLALCKFSEYFSKREKPIKVRIIKLKYMFCDRLTEKRFRQTGFDIKFLYTDKNTVAAAIYKAILSGEKVVLLSDMDRFVRKTKFVKMNFLNHNVKIASGTAFMASKTNLPVLPIYMFDCGNNNFQLKINSPIQPYNKTISEIMIEVINDLEQEILKNPSQWHKWHRLPLFMET
ncbi:MAG: lysophospholipid acyltransferase family protein [Endomicrobium sp.]|jgi:lauroyl/myristoyl acyltransferase|nr:lysophospholipid acyltransferase family protein [Endomicrobium sp.]